MGLIAGLYAVGKWLIMVSVKVVLWAVTNPLGAVIVASIALTTAEMLRSQPWAGSNQLAELIGLGGKWLLWLGVAGLVGRALWKFVPLKYKFLAMFIYARIVHWLRPRAVVPQLQRVPPAKAPFDWAPGGPVWEGPPGF